MGGARLQIWLEPGSKEEGGETQERELLEQWELLYESGAGSKSGTVEASSDAPAEIYKRMVRCPVLLWSCV